LSQLGYYDPSKDILKLDITGYEKWVKNGAKPTETVASLFRKCKRKAVSDK
jgi:ribosomal protein S16